MPLDLQPVEDSGLDLQPVEEDSSIPLLVKRNRLGESREDLEAKAAMLRNEAIGNKVGDVALNAAMWGAYLTPLRETAARLMGVEQPVKERPALVDPETLRQTVAPITQSMGLTDPITQGVTEFGAETGSALTSPSALETMATGPAAPLIFATEMAKSSPQALEQLRQASSTGDLKETTKAALNAGLSIAGPLGIARGYSRLEKPATEVAQPKETSASTQQEAATVHGDVLPLAGEGEGKVPVKEGEPRVQPEAEGGVPKEEVTPASTLETVIRDPNAKANNRNSTEAGMAVKSVDDLEQLAELREKLYKERQDLLQQVRTETDPAKKESLMNEALILSNKLQLPREAIEVATNTGGWAEEVGKTELGERPLDFNKNPEVADWMEKNAKRIGTTFERPTKPTPTETVLASQSENPLTDAINKYEDTGEIQTVRDLVNHVEGLINNGLAPESLRSSIEDYRASAKEDFEQLAGRGDMDEAESKFLDAVKKLTPKEVKPPTSTTPKPSKLDVSSILKAKDEESLNRAIGQLSRTATDAEMQQIKEAVKQRQSTTPTKTTLASKTITPESARIQELFEKEADLRNQFQKWAKTRKEGREWAGTPIEELNKQDRELKSELTRLIEAERVGKKESLTSGEISKLKPAIPSQLLLESQAAPTHGLPAGVPDRGPTFASELMEASRQLGALVRSRATLRPGVLGQFVRTKLAGIRQADKIEVGDIRNQKTVAHEIGHSLDGILWPDQDFGESQKSLAARVGTGTGKELSKELTTVSELMRGPMTGSAGHVAYRKRATELIADYYALYAHDPARAKAMAPKFTKGFEQALARDKNTADVVQGVVAGNVIPKPPNSALKKQLAGITGTPPQPTVAMPGKVPLPRKVEIAREHEVQQAAQELVKGEDRMFRSKVEGSRIVHDEAVKRVPEVSDRNDVGAFIEGMGNLEKPGDTIDRVRTRMTPAKEWMVKHFRYRMELSRQQLNQYLKGITEGEYVKFLEDYLPHIYKDVGPKLQGALRAWKNSPHAKQRILPTLKEGAELGLTPITQDPAVLYELSEKMNWRVATNKKVLDAMRNDVKTSSGSPVVVPHGEGGDGWIHTEHPLFQRVYAKGTPKGLMLWERGADVHPDVWPALRQILEPAPSWTISKAYDAVNAFTRASRFLGSVFHDFSLAKAAVGSMARWYNPLRGLVRLFEKNPLTGEREAFRTTRSLGKEMRQNEQIVTEAALDGLEFSARPSQAFEQDAHSAIEKLANYTEKVPYLGKTLKTISAAQEWRRKNLWENTHDALKIVAHNDITTKVLNEAPPGTDVKRTREQIASFLNDSMGGQEWQTKFWSSPTLRKYVSRLMLAPDWTISVLRSVPFVSDVSSLVRGQGLARLTGRGAERVQFEGALGNKLRAKALAVELGVLAVSAASIQYAINKAFGDPKKGDKEFPWDNELDQRGRIDVTPIMRKMPWHDPKDPTRQYINLGKREGEVLRWFSQPTEEFVGKLSTPAAIVYEQISGQEGRFKAQWKQDHESFIESLPSRTVAIGKQALPFAFQGNQFALSVPMAKGMTKYKAQQAYESMFELATQPNRFKSFLRGQEPSEGTLAQMTSQITDAAKRNGVPAEAVLKRALQTVRGHHYNEFFKAFEAGDHKKMNEEAKALVTLGASGKGIEESVRRRIELQPQSPESAIVVPPSAE